MKMVIHCKVPDMTRAQEDAEAFTKELHALLEKYKAAVRIRESSARYSYIAEGIDVEFDGIYTETEIVRPSFTVEFDAGMQ